MVLIWNRLKQAGLYKTHSTWWDIWSMRNDCSVWVTIYFPWVRNVVTTIGLAQVAVRSQQVLGNRSRDRSIHAARSQLSYQHWADLATASTASAAWSSWSLRVVSGSALSGATLGGTPNIQILSDVGSREWCEWASTWSGEELSYLRMVFGDLSLVSSSTGRNPKWRCICRYHFRDDGRHGDLHDLWWLQEHDHVLPLRAWNYVRLPMFFRRLGIAISAGWSRDQQLHCTGHWRWCDGDHEDHNASFLWQEDGWFIFWIQFTISHDVDESSSDVGFLYNVWLVMTCLPPCIWGDFASWLSA